MFVKEESKSTKIPHIVPGTSVPEQTKNINVDVSVSLCARHFSAGNRQKI